MIYGYARCSTNESKQDINRQIKELKAAGADEVIFEYEHGDARTKKELNLLLELAQAYRFSMWKTIRLIYLPCLRPYFTAAITTATGLAWKSGVAAEVLCLPTSAMGTQIFNTTYYVEIPELFAWTTVVVTLSLLLEKLLRALLGRKGVE